jgi:predicted DNA-binding protein
MSDPENTTALPLTPELQARLQALVVRSQKVMAHGWMIRTFIKHSDEVEDYPELNEMARTIFDVFRAVETQVEDPLSYFKTVRKKLGRLSSAAEQFEKDAWHASTHTNFQQAAIAARFLGEQLQDLVTEAEKLVPRPTPPKITLPIPSRPTPGSGVSE